MPKDIWTQAAEESYQGVATEEPSTSKPMDDIWTQAAQQSLGIVPDNPIQPTMDPEQYRMAGEAMQTMGQPDKPGRNVTIDPLDVALRSPEARAKAQQIAKKGRGFWGELFNSYVEGSLMVGGGMAGTVAEAARLADKPGLNWIGEKASQISKKSRQARQVPELAAGQKGTAGEFVAQAVGNAFPFMAASVGATMLTGTPLAAFGVAFSVEGEETYQKAIKDGASFEKANLERLVVGTLNGAIESLQVGTIFKGGQKAAKPILDAAKQKAMKKILAAGGKASVALVKTSVEEGLEEALQETISMTAPMIHGQPVPTFDQYIKQAGKAGLGGAVAGGILGGGRAMMEVTSPQAQAKAESVTRIEAAGYDTKTAEKIATDIQELQAQADAAKPPAPLTPEQSKNVTATLAELEAASKPPAEAASVPEAVSPAQATPPPAKAKGEAKPSEPPYIPEGVVPPQAAKPKEPWEMTRDEYAKTSSVVRGNNYIAVKSPRDGGDFIIRSLETSKYSDADAIALSRKDHIRQALSSGKPVPPAVLAEYPELKQLPKKGEGKPDYLDEGLELSIDVVHTKTALGTEAPLHLPEGRYRFKVTQDPNLKSNWFLQLVDDSGNPTQTKTIDGKTFAGYGTSKSRPTIISGMTQIQPKGTPDVQKETAQALQVENSKAAATAGEIPAPASVDFKRSVSKGFTVKEPTIMEPRVEFTTVGGEKLKGIGYALPGFEEYQFALVKPRGSVSRRTKQGWTIYEVKSGLGVVAHGKKDNRFGYEDTAQGALGLASKLLSTVDKAWLDKNISKQLVGEPIETKSMSQTPTVPKPSNRGGFLAIPKPVADFAEYVVRLFSPAESRIGKLGTSGKKLVARAKRAYEISQVHGANDTETMQKVTDKLPKAEKDTLGYAVNYVAWKKEPNAITRNSMKKRGGNLMAPPTSKAQEKAARAFLFLADRARRRYETVGGDVRWGGIPWPQRFTKDGYKLYTAAIKAVDKDGNPILAELKRNGLISKMVQSGQYADEGTAWKALKRLEAQTKRQVYAYMEKSKTPLPAEYLEMGATIARDLEFWTSMHQHVELAKEFGIEHELAFEYLRDIEAVNGKDAAQSTLEWWREVIGDEQPKGEGQIWKERIARGLGQFQVFKLSPFTSAQNVFQRFLTMMDYGLITTLRGQQLAWTKAGREAARRSGSIPFRADESGLLTELSTEKARGIARAWIEAIGMGFTERGNNYTSSMTASLGIIQDLHDLAKGTSKLGQIIRNIFTLGGESKGAIQRRLQRQGINWKAVTKRGYLTADELRVAMLRAAKSKQFRSDLFSMPSWWQDSPMWRQVFRYKPFSYHTMTQIWTMAGSEAVKGNFRPLIAFLLVTTITGEVYNYLKGKLTDTDRDDETIKYRLLKDFADGGGLGLFSSLLWGKDLIDFSVNFIGGPNLSTARNLLETIQKTKDAPEHAKEHWLEAVQREIPAVRQLMNLADRDAAKNRIENAKVRKMFDGKDADLFYYGNDLYDAALKEDREGVRYAMEAMRHHGMEDDAILQSVTSRKKIKISGKEQAKQFPGLNEGQMEIVGTKLQQHDRAVGVIKSMLAVGKIDPKVSEYYSEISRVRGKDGRGEELTKDEDLLLKKNSRVQRAITHWQQKADEATDGKVRKEYYDRIKNLIDRLEPASLADGPRSSGRGR